MQIFENQMLVNLNQNNLLVYYFADIISIRMIWKNLWNQNKYYHITIVVFDPCLISFNEQLVEVMGNLCACLIVCRMWAISVRMCVSILKYKKQWNDYSLFLIFSLKLIIFTYVTWQDENAYEREKHLWRDEMTNHPVFFFLVFT